MALDPRLECLPEHEGPAFRTWQLIMQTTMGKVMQPSGFQLNSSDTIKKALPKADEFIPLVNTNESSTNSENENNLKRKKSQSSEVSSDDDNDEKDNINIAPWKGCEKYPENAYGLHLEIKDFFTYMSPLPEEALMRKDVVKRMSDLIISIWPAAKVEVFGSFRTNLYIPTSDIDLAVFGKWEKLPLFTLEKALISNEIAEPATIKVLDKASVPIIKLTDKLSKIRVDISFNTESSVRSAEMVKSYIKEYKILPYLFLTLKHFLVQRDLNEVFTGGISSYCLMLLAISFLQRHRRRYDVKKDDANLGVLLMEFFELYGRNFNYQRIGIKIKNGGCYVSKEEIKKELGNGEYPSLLCIEDPVTLALDIGRSSYGILRVKETFEYAFNVVDSALRNKSYFKVNPKSTYLSRIISVPQDLIEYRRWVKETYHTLIHRQKTPSPISPLYQVNIPQLQANGRQALLPTPPSPYSPHLTVVTPPFSPYTTNSNVMPYSPVAFFASNSVPRQQVILHNVSANNVVTPSTQINRLPSLHMAPPRSNSMSSTIQLGQVSYVVPGVFNGPQIEQVIQTPTTPVFSPEKVSFNNNTNPTLSSSQHVANTQQRNQNMHKQHDNQSYERTNFTGSSSNQSFASAIIKGTEDTTCRNSIPNKSCTFSTSNKSMKGAKSPSNMANTDMKVIEIPDSPVTKTRAFVTGQSKGSDANNAIYVDCSGDKFQQDVTPLNTIINLISSDSSSNE